MTATQSLGRLLTRAWVTLRPPAAPDHPPEPAPDRPVDGRGSWLAQLSRTHYALEQTRVALLRDGWTRGTWFAEERESSSQACLVGTLLRMADDPDQVPTHTDVWHCVDELYEAMHETLGHPSMPPGRAYPHAERRIRLRGLTSWNDAAGRSRDQVIDLVDRAIARTIVAGCR